jgi:type II secretory pathway component PulC
MYDDALYKIQLTLPNLLSDSYKKPEETYSELIKMEADDIGTRPRIIEHLVTLTYTPFIADGQLVSPGLNPALFAQAGFKGDDVLKTINGKSVTVASELEEIQRELKMASTLEFVVMRRGKLVTLFLDIPSESLELTVD